jgi:5-methylcytosine-specific restriction endonuclease McrA
VKHPWGRIDAKAAIHHARGKKNHPPNRNKSWWRTYRARMDAGLEICRLCRERPASIFGHLLPDSLGGRFKFSNLTLTCKTCEFNQGNRPISHLPSLAMEEASAPPERRWSRVEVEARRGGEPT